MKCPFCNSTNIIETGKTHRGNKRYVEDDDDIEITKGWLHVISCNDCKMKFFVDKEILSRIEK